MSALAGAAMARPALAQESAAADEQSAGLQEIIVTAQKREQSIQDVPIAITALDTRTLQANRITSVVDLSGLAPGLTTAPSPGGTKVPQFSLRGATTNGVVPGSDRAVGIYIDGVYISASRGAIFDLPDIQRIEVLRGPQGTLFGRNATAGAISVVTRDPTGEFGVKLTGTLGNYDQRRLGISVNLPQVGPFSGYVSYLHSERRGDVENTAAGITWDRTSSPVAKIAKIQQSPRYLGDDNTESLFAALKFESGDFTTVYKFDRMRSKSTPPAVGFSAYNPAAPLVGNLLTALITSQSFPVPIASDGKRPDGAPNGYAIVSPQRADGHSLTSTWQVSDALSFKNLFAYRTSFIFGASPLDGLSALRVTPQAVGPLATFYGISSLSRAGVNVADPANAALVQSTIANIAAGLNSSVGSPFVAIVSQTEGRTRQISDEIQANYESDFVTATAGALWFNAKDWTGENLQQNTPSFTVFNNGVVPNANIGRTFNEITSLAAYAQLEFHVTDQLDLVLGGRITRDKKTGTFRFGPNLAGLTTVATTYRKTKPSFLVGVNYQPNPDTLLYAKYSTAFVSGGSTGGVPYDPETVDSIEAGFKAALLNRRLQANLALYHAKYKTAQGASSSTTPGLAEAVNTITGDPNRATTIGTFVLNRGDLTAKGFEFDLTAAPVTGVTLGGSLSYTHSRFSKVNPFLLAANLGVYKQILTPPWTANFWAEYKSPPIGLGDARIGARIDGRWQSDMNLNANPDRPEYSTWAAGTDTTPAYWVFNGRLALEEWKLGGLDTEVALWGRNLTDNRSSNYALFLGSIVGTNYIPARTYGIDLTVRY